MKHLSSNIMGPAQQIAILEKKIKDLKDMADKLAEENMSPRTSHNKHIEELKKGMTQLIDECINLANQLAESRKSNTALNEKYEALRAEKKGNSFNHSTF